MSGYQTVSDNVFQDVSNAGPSALNTDLVNRSPSPARARRFFGLTFLLSDVLALGLSLVIGSWVAILGHRLFAAAGRDALHFNAGETFASGAPIGACLLLSLLVTGDYRNRRPFWNEFGRLVAASFVAVLVAGFYSFAFHITALRSATIAPWVLFPVVAEVFRHLSRHVLHSLGLWEVPTLMIGSVHDIQSARKVLAGETFSAAKIVGEMDVAETSAMLNAEPGTRNLRNYQIFLCLDPNAVCTRNLIEQLTRLRLPFALLPQTAMPAHGLTYASFFSHDTVIMSYQSNLEEPIQRVIKFSFDFVISALLLLAALPVFAILYVLIALDGGQPIYGHRRIGHNGKTFSCLKFRSMARNSDELLAKLLASNPEAAEEWRQTQKLRLDPRITRIGHFIRKTSLDELPQLINVLRGEMSLVGPRPIVQAEVHHYGDNIAYYHAIRPGITGLWQVSGRSDTGYDERVQLDRWYVRNWTLWHDIAILAKTLPAVLLRRGAR